MRKRILFGVVWLAAGMAAAATTQMAGSLADLSLEELSSIVVTSVSRRGEPVSQAPASVYVITAQDIRRSGATSLAEALRLAPNLLVARVNAHDYAITSSRGFLSTTGNKLLVMIDGRSIYTPLFSGVLWDTHDVMLEDVERIEVISGPGGTTWGTNAVIGVINVVTKAAGATAGALASATAGNKVDGLAARYGGKLGSGDFRVYGRHFDRDRFSRASGGPAPDGGRRRQAGFRADWADASGGVTLQGDAYDVERMNASGRLPLSGFNLLGRWTRALEGGSGISVQAYFDRNERQQPGTFVETLDVFDVEAQYAAAQIGAHRLTAGAGYRSADDRTQGGSTFVFMPADRRLRWFNVFLQDEIAIRQDLRLVLGARAEHNTYTGWETMPGARLAWQAAPGHLLWTAVSRAVRSPSRLDRELFAPGTPPFTTLAGGPRFVSETSKVFELGYRAQASAALTYSLTVFLHDHDDLRSVEPNPGAGPTVENRVKGRTRGLEGWGSWQAARAWRLSGGFVLLDQDLVNEPGSLSVLVEANDPSHQWLLRSSHDLGERVEADVMMRRVATLPSPRIPAYTALDARIAWRAVRGLEIALVGQNLNKSRHAEFGAAATRVEIPRSLFLNVRLALP